MGTTRSSSWDAKTGEVKETFSDLTEPVHVLAISPDCKSLVVSGGWHIEEGEVMKSCGAIRFFPLVWLIKKQKPSAAPTL
jgi:WD40 repeat protein